MTHPTRFRTLDCGGRPLSLDRPRIMGVLNVTPDSFSDGGQWRSREDAMMHALRMAAAGADLIDIGGESTRPGAQPVSAAEEMERTIPLIERLHDELLMPISIDTSKPEVMRAAAEAGAGLINDVFALRREGALETAVELGLPVCLMHMQGEPGSMQQDPRYDDVVAEVESFLLERAATCEEAGLARGRILIDPGFGFGKLLEHNLALLRGMPSLAGHGYPVLAGLSRKSMLGELTGRPVTGRVSASVAAAMLAVQGGAAVVRVHDIAETRDALAVLNAVWPRWAAA
jgi:dihydropteroate synthase